MTSLLRVRPERDEALQGAGVTFFVTVLDFCDSDVVIEGPQGKSKGEEKEREKIERWEEKKK